jgi:hypothetical protein
MMRRPPLIIPGLAVFDVGKEPSSHAKATGGLLQFAGIDLLLVRSLASGVGSVEPHRYLLASAPCVVTGCVSVRDGDRLLRQLD